MKLDRYDKAVLTVIALCLLALLWRGNGGPGLLRSAHADSMGKLNFSKDGGVGVTCSGDGKYVFIAGNEGVIRSDDYGRIGSWEKTIKED